MKKTISFIILFLFFHSSNAREGMWFPQLLEQLNETEMRQLGMKISAEDIYSVNKSSLKDAVVQFGGGCTGEIISERGLLITNHHCGFSQIQSLSSIENNLLKNGFWAMSDTAEIPVPGLTVTFVKEIVDVSSIILVDVSEDLNEQERSLIIKSKSDSIEKARTDGKNIKAFVRSFYSGNEYFLFITQVFRDIRFVGAPPVSVGKFGGETDNWLWPRHTGDFSLFRIYCDSLNLPADYSKNNVPYTSMKFLEINIEGVKENDFTFVYGFPGRTNEYLSASSLDLIYSQTNPNKIKIREERLNIWRTDMNSNDTIYLKYAPRFKTLANYYKKWRGENLGLKSFNVVEQKKRYESKINAESNGMAQPILDNIEAVNERLKPLSYNSDFFVDGLLGIEIAGLSQKFTKLITLSQSDTTSKEVLNKELERLKADYRGFHKNYSKKTDRKICLAMLNLADKHLSQEYKPAFYSNLKNENDIEEYTDRLFDGSLLTDTSSMMKYLSAFKKRKIKRVLTDKVYLFGKEITGVSKLLNEKMAPLNIELGRLQRNYVSILRSVDKERKFYPDANSTLRVAYGNVKSMNPSDGKIYNYFTTTDGILEKIDNSNPDFEFPAGLEKLIRDKDFGAYGKNGSVPVAFLASNHTTNGNSGSPVLNAKGQLIGINFDRVWEGNMSDYFFDENTCRNIAMDMHYFLFVVEKYGKASRLIEEMKIIR
ncbi:MAG TPA: S46 family peptidase [Bacteroidia bacterium]|nr:S46 family peptidase [Bacteroidia bacterium]HQW22960.1 S46 family peptidase [Bacteroidia bacterium]